MYDTYDTIEETHTELQVLNEAELDAVAGGQDINFNATTLGIAALNFGGVNVGLLASTGTVTF